MQTVLIVVHLMIVVALIGTVLLQRSEGGGLGIGGGGGFMSSRGTANVLTRATAILALVFFVTSLLLSIMAGAGRKPTSILGGPTAPASQPAPASPTGGGVLDALKGPAAPAPAAPAAPPAAPAAPAVPDGPQVPRSQ